MNKPQLMDAPSTPMDVPIADVRILSDEDVLNAPRRFDSFGSELIERDLWLRRVQILLAEDGQRLWDQKWRLDNLYWITNKDGQRVLFHLNEAQEEFYKEMDYLNIVLKARQRGFTTFIDLFILDSCLFNEDVKAGIIAHHLDDAKVIFRDKVQFPYENLPGAIKGALRANNDRIGEMTWSNGSSIRVSTSMRSGTLQLLHVSEYGKIAAKWPEKAREIKTGAFEAVGVGQMIFVESTAEGRGGEFYSMCQKAMAKKQQGKKLGPLDFKFHFFPWWGQKEYVLDPRFVAIPQELEDYFEDLETMHQIYLSLSQRAWYTVKHETHKDDMTREYPSYPEEAFKASVEGAYFAKVLAQIRMEKRIGKVPYDPAVPVNTFWDIGLNDTMAIWFHQQVGMEHRLIDYHEKAGEALAYFARILQEKNYVYGVHYLPHDARARRLGKETNKTMVQMCTELGIRPTRVVQRAKNEEEVLQGIEASRSLLAKCWIDEARCDSGLKSLESYRKEWDDRGGCWKNRPFHDWASNGADALRTGACGLNGNVSHLTRTDAYPEVVPDF